MAISNTKTISTSGGTYDSGAYLAQNWVELGTATSVGYNIYAIEDNTLSSSLKVLGSGDQIYIEGFFADFQYKQNGKTITLDNGIARSAITLSSMTNKVQVTTTLVFLDGSVTLTNKAGGTKVSMNGFNDDNVAKSQLLTTKYADVKINADDSNTTAATYFSSLPVNDTTTFTLTVNPDTFVGSTGNDYFDGTVLNTLSTFDKLDGGTGTNSLIANISGTTLPAGLTIANIQTATLQTSGAGLTADVSTWTGLTDATIIDATAGTVALTAAATTNVTSSFIGVGAALNNNTIDGGKNISVTAVSIADSDTINVGGTTAASGNITINAALTAGATAGTITARTSGGTSISVTETGGTTHGAINATDGAAAATVAGTLSTVSIDGAIGSTITSNALTSLSIANAVSGTVTITNTLTSAIAAHTSALALTLTKAAITLVDTNAEIGTLNITLGGTANTTGSTAQDSTLAAITDANLSALTVTGAATNKLTLNAATGLAGLKTLSVAGAMSFTAGVDLSAVATGLTGVTTTTTGTTTLGATTVTKGIALATTYTGGAGNDVLTVGATTVAVNLGTGTNTLYMLSGTTALGAGGSITSGSGTADTLVLTAADSTTLSTAGAVQTAFKAEVTGFEVLSVGAAAAATAVNATGFGTFNSIKLAGQQSNAWERPSAT